MSFKKLINSTFVAWSDANVPRLSAALSFYTAFSLGPLLLIAVCLVGLAFGRSAAEGQLLVQLNEMVGPQLAGAIQDVLKQMANQNQNVLGSVIGFLILLLGATGTFLELRGALNTLWQVPPTKDSGIRVFVKERLLSFLMVLVVGALLLSLLIANALVDNLKGIVNSISPVALQIFNFFFSWLVVSFLCFLPYKFIPNTNVFCKSAWVGAFPAAFLFSIGKSLLSYYLTRSLVSSPYGASSSIVIVLMWTYYNSMIFFFGAELSHQYQNLLQPGKTVSSGVI